jgi:proteasome lid subunit RPN8/RPN11
MTPLRLREDVRAEMIAHARQEAPNECCGLLIGRASSIDECVRARNLHASPTRYLLDPADHIAAMRRIRGSDRSIVGAYHSHPRTPPIPSETDRAEAFYPDFVWVIVSLLDSEGDVAAFTLTGSGLTPVPIVSEPSP